MYVPFYKMFISMFLTIFPFSFLIGFLFPFGCRLFYSLTFSNLSMGSVYIVESAGSLIGGSLFSLYLANNFNPFSIIFCMLIISIIVIWIFWSDCLKTKIAFFVASIIFLVLFLPVMGKINQKTIKDRWDLCNKGIRLVDSVDSKYQNLSLGFSSNQYSLYSNNLYLFSFPDKYQEALTANLIMTQHRLPERVLVIGEINIGTIREMLKYGIFLDCVILDNKLMDLISPYLNSEDTLTLNSGNVRIINIDGRFFIKTNKSKYDIVYLSLSDPSTAMINRYYTLGFFKEVKDILSSDGIFVSHLTSSESYIGSDLAGYNSSIVYTLSKVFEHVIFSPGDINYYFASSSRDSVTDNAGILTERYNRRKVDKGNQDTTYFSPYYFKTAFYRERINYLKEKFSRQAQIINTDLKPISYFLNLLVWDKISGSKLGTILKFMEKLNIKLFVLALIFLLMMRLIYMKFRRISGEKEERFNYVFTIFTVGLTSIVLEIMLLFAYQNLYGYLYQMLGILIASFMFGLAVGGAAANSLIYLFQPKNKYNITIFIIVQSVIALISLILPSALNLFSGIRSQFIFISMIFIIGFFAGLVFPLGGVLYLRSKPEPGKVAGVFNFFDHIGASVGSLIFGVILIPVLGIVNSCILLFSLNLVGIFLWILHKKDVIFNLNFRR